MLRKTLLPLLACLLGAAPLGPAVAQGPSFDCARARTGPERAICADPALSALDRRMADLYVGRLGEVADGGPLAAVQSLWLRWRDTCGADAACLGRRYDARILDLSPGGTAPDVSVADPPGGGTVQRIANGRYETVLPDGMVFWVSVDGDTRGTDLPDGTRNVSVFVQVAPVVMPAPPPGPQPWIDAVERRLLQAVDSVVPPTDHAAYRALHAALPADRRVVRHIQALEYFARD